MTTRIAVGMLLLITLADLPHPAAAGGEQSGIRLVARMQVGRSSATATAIPGDRVLIAGGMAGGSSAVRGYEIFDASRNRVEAAGQMRESRVAHTATPLRDGRVLVIGGYNGEYLATAELFDPGTGRFTPAGALKEGRSGHTATLLQDGTVLVVGGIGDGWTFLASAERYDPQTGRFLPVGSMSSARESHTATLLADGRVLVTGGHRGRRDRIVVYPTTEIFDPETGTFAAGPALGTPRHKHEAVALADGRVLIVGGSDPRDRRRYTSTELYDPRTGVIAAGPPMKIARFKFRDSAVRLLDGRVLIAGGGRYAELFDPRAAVFETVAGDLGHGYSFASAALLSNGDVVIVGGYDDTMRNSDGVWRFRR